MYFPFHGSLHHMFTDCSRVIIIYVFSLCLFPAQVDEADRVLDLGFKDAMNKIIRALPSEERQTMLFSATQSQAVRQLAKSTLQNPQFISVHQGLTSVTPAALKQHYMLVEANVKYDVLWSFIKTHLKSKTLIFQSTCKQVRFTYEMFRKLRPGTPLMHVHGMYPKGYQGYQGYRSLTVLLKYVYFHTSNPNYPNNPLCMYVLM